MANRLLHTLLGYLHQGDHPDSDNPSDVALLRRFVGRDEAAFATLLSRHGAMVLGVCRRLLRQEQEAEDAFQATFLVLASKARSLTTKATSLGSWLHGVAVRVSLKARARLLRRECYQREAMENALRQGKKGERRGELLVALDEEMDRLPQRFKQPLILCYLESKTIEEAARDLGWSEGTVRGRLYQSRELLRQRLSRRGWTATEKELASVCLPVPVGLYQATLTSAVGIGQGATVVAGPAVVLARGVLSAMMLTRMIVLAGTLVLLSVCALGALVLARGDPRQTTESPKTPAISADEGKTDEKKPKDGNRTSLQAVLPFVDDHTCAVLRIDLEQLDLKDVNKPLAPLLKALGQDFPLKEGAKFLDLLKNHKVQAVTFVAQLPDFPGKPPRPQEEFSWPFLVATLGPGTDATRTAPLLNESKAFLPQKWSVIQGQLVLGDEKTLRRLEGLIAEEIPELTQAEEVIGNGLAQLILVIPEGHRPFIEEMNPRLPNEFGGGSIKVLTRGIKWAAVAFDAKPALTLRVTVQASGKETAGRLKKVWSRVLSVALAQPLVKESAPNLAEQMGNLVPEIEGDRLQLRLKLDALLAQVELFEKLRLASQHAISQNNLKQLLLAFLNYNGSYGIFPAAAITSKDGKKLLSWRVAILPYIEQQHLYKEFHLDEPWDSEHNKKLIPRMPATFASPGNRKLTAEGKTPYVVPVGKETMFSDLKGKRMRIGDTDGLSTTIMLVETQDANAVIWTKPMDLDYDPKNPLNGLGGNYPDGFLVGFADGTVNVLSKKIKLDSLRAMFTPHGGALVPQEDR